MSTADKSSLFTNALAVLVVATVITTQFFAFAPIGLIGSPADVDTTGTTDEPISTTPESIDPAPTPDDPTPSDTGGESSDTPPATDAPSDDSSDTSDQPAPSTESQNDPRDGSSDSSPNPPSSGSSGSASSDDSSEKRDSPYSDQARDNPGLTVDTPPVNELPEPNYNSGSDVVDSGTVVEVDLTTGEVSRTETPSGGSANAPTRTVGSDEGPATEETEIIPQAINGDDGRVIIGDTTEYPYRMTTQLLVNFDGEYYLCSGAMVSSYHVLTSAHCVAQFDDYADDVSVYPGRDGQFAPYGEAKATNMRVYEAWEQGEPVSYDIALLTLDKNIGQNTGWFGYSTYDSDDSRYYDAIEFAGYPSDKSGNELYNQTGEGIYVDEFYPSTHWYTMDSEGGQSGSGVWYYNETTDEPRLLSVHGYGSSPYNLGIRIDDEKFTDITGWIANDSAPESYAQVVDDGNEWFNISPDTLTPGEEFTVESDVRNIGTSEAVSYTITYYLSSDKTLSDDDYQFAQAGGSNLGALDYADVNYTGSFPSVPAGDYYVIRASGESTSSLSQESTTDGTTADTAVATDSTITVENALTSEVSVDITSPAEGDFVDSTNINLSGTVSSEGGVIETVEVSGDGGDTWSSATVNNNSWAYTYPASGDGDYTLLVRATDDIGTTATDEVNVSVDSNSPLLNVLSPTSGLPVDVNPGESVFVDIEYSEANPENITVALNSNGSTLVTETISGLSSGYATESAELIIPSTAPSGDYNTSVTMTDAAQNTATVTETSSVSVISEAPSITSVSVSPELVAPGDDLTVSVTASDDQGVASVTADGFELTQQSGDTWEGVISASSNNGVQEVDIEVTDEDGQTASTSGTYEVDATAPTFDSVSLSETLVGAGDSLTITVFASDSNGVSSVTADGVALTQQGDGSWTGSLTAASSEGTTSVNVEAADSLGNTETTSVSYTVDATPPQVSVSTPQTSNSSSVTVSGSITDANGISSATLTVNENEQTLLLEGDGSFSTTVSLVEGTNTFELSATDSAGNSASDTAETEVDTTSPSLTVSSPSETNDSDVTVTGTADDENGLASVSISVDGEAPQSVTPDSNGDFSLTVSLSEGEHDFVATAEDTFGNVDTASTTTTVDTTAPTVTLDAPATSDSLDVAVTGSATDLNGIQSAELSVNGESQSVSLDSQGEFSETVSLTEGENDISFTATDAVGNSETVTTTTLVELDTNAPEITINAPTLTDETDVTVSGSVTDESDITSATISVNGGTAQALTLDSNGDYSSEVSLTEGENTLTVSATDEFANSDSVSTTVVVDANAPSLSLSVPSESNTIDVTVSGSVSDSNGVSTASLLVNGASQTITLDSSGEFEETVSLSEGDNTVVLQATDTLGNSASTSAETVVDTTAPSVSLIAPATAETTEVTVSGSVEDTNGVQSAELTVNGVSSSLTLAQDGSFSETLSLSEGENTIVLSATDAFENEAQTSATTIVTLDTDAPTVTLSAPATSNDATVSVSGSVTDASDITTAQLEVNGFSETLTLASDGSFNTDVALSEGSNSLVVSATDEYGNTGTESTETVVDTTAPDVSLSVVEETLTSSVEVSGSVSDENGIQTVELTVNGDGQSISVGNDGTFTVTVPLESGENTVELSAVDSFNNENTTQKTVTYTPLDDLTVNVDPIDGPTADDIVAVSGGFQNSVGPTAVTVESTVDSNTVTVPEGDSTFTVPVRIAEGQNTVDVTVLDAESRTASTQTTVTLDTGSPSIENIELNTTTVFPGEDVLVTVDATDDITSVESVTADGVSLTQNTDGSWEGILTAPENPGSYSILVVATDEVGNTAGSSAAYAVEQKPDLGLSVESPPSLLDTQSVTLSGEVTNALGDATVTISSPVDTETLTLNADGPFSTEIGLEEGDNTITVEVSDSDGRTVTETVTTTVDTGSPVLTLNAPATSDSTEVTITGTVSDAGDIAATSLSVNSESTPVTLDSNGEFSQTVTLDDGENTITLSATDAAGNENSVTQTTTVSLDTTPPTVTLEAPATSTESTVTVTGTVVDESEVDSVSLSVDGEHSQDVTLDSNNEFETTLSLSEGENTISLSATDAYGNEATKTATTFVDSTAPTVTLDAPANSDSTDVSVSGTVVDNLASDPSATISVNGEVVGTVELASDGSFTTTVSLNEGENTIVLRAVDALGNDAQASATTTVELDSDAPVVTVNSPTETSTSEVSISGTVTDDSVVQSVELTVGGETTTVPVASDGSYDASFTLADGQYTVTATATDEFGNTGSASTSVLVDTTAPTVSLTAPETSDSTDVTVSGSVTDASGISTVELLVNGNPVPVSLDAQGDFETMVTMNEGENTIEVTASDALQNTGSASATTTVELAPTEPLEVTVDDVLIGQGNLFTISGTASGDGVGEVVISIGDDVEVTEQLDASGTYEFTSEFADGTYPVTVTATDSTGDTRSATTSFTLDSIPPTVSVDSPEVSNTNEVVVTGSATDENGVENAELVINNGEPVSVNLDSDGAFETTLTLSEGENTIEFRATDSYGNVRSASTNTLVATTAPEVSLNAYDGVNSLYVSGVVDDNGRALEYVNLYVDGDYYSDVVLDGGEFAESLDLSDGQYTVEVRAGDAYGNEGAASDTGIVDSTAPELTLNAPSESDTKTVTVDGTVNDAGIGVMSADLYVNGEEVESLELSANGEFETTVSLSEGENTISVTAYDQFENAQSVSTVTTVEEPDTSAPRLTLTVPEESNSSVVLIEGAAVDDTVINTANLTVDGETTRIELSDSVFRTEVELADGEHVITLSAVDEAGNEASTSKTIRVDTTSPEVVLNAPQTSETTDVNVSGTVTDRNNPTAELLVNGKVVESYTSIDGSIWTTVSLNEGENTVTLRGTDSFGNTNESTQTIVVEQGGEDVTAPEISIDAPEVTNESNAPVTVTLSDEGLITDYTFEVNSESAALKQESSEATLAYTVPLEEGVNTITVTATDNAGNTATKTAEIFADFSAPELNDVSSDDTPGNSLTFTAGDAASVFVDTTDVGSSVSSVTVDGESLGQIGDSGIWEGSFPVSDSPGSHEMTIVITDAAGNTAEFTERYTARAGSGGNPSEGDINNVSPVLERVVLGDEPGTYVAIFGYDNRNDVAVTESVGENNNFYGGDSDRGQPTEFAPGRHTSVFSVEFDGSNLVWTLGDSTSTASGSASSGEHETGKEETGDDDSPDNSTQSKSADVERIANPDEEDSNDGSGEEVGESGEDASESAENDE